MTTSDIVGIVIAVIIIAVIAGTALRIVTTRRELRQRYGDEYDRAITEHGGRAAAEAELRSRERRHEKLELHELSPEVRGRYRTAWIDLQGQFIEDPKAAVRSADQLVSQIVADRGYPVVDFSDRLAHLSVEHASVLSQYREAHDISVRNDAGTASTEELRQALVHYRELIADLLGDQTLAPHHTEDGITVIQGSDEPLPELSPELSPPPAASSSETAALSPEPSSTAQATRVRTSSVRDDTTV